MYRSSSNRIFPIILVVVVIVAIIAGLITAGRYIFGGNGGGDQDAEQSRVETARDQLLTLSNDRSIRLTVRGAIVADERFNTQRIEISPGSRVYTNYRGYLEEVEDQKSFDNNMEAYEEFVHALDKAEFTSPGRLAPEEADDLRGICATGRVYEYEIVGAAGVVEKMWTSTCSGSPGTFGASLTQVNNLFNSQIPDQNFRDASVGQRLRLQ